MPSRQVAIGLFLIVLTACHRNEKFSTPLWFFSYSTPTPSKWDSILGRGSFLDLQPDGSYTRNFDRFEYGKWSRIGDLLYLTDQRNVTYEYRISDTGKNKLSLLITAKKTAFFESGPRPRADTVKNPFSLYNNRWRIAATRPESLPELQQRILNHLHFWETYFRWGDDNDVDALDVGDIPSPLRIHGNGFGLIRYRSLPPRWKSCFFNEADCQTADSLFREVFKRTDIKWPDVGDNSHVGKNLISGIQQLESALRPE